MPVYMLIKASDFGTQFESGHPIDVRNTSRLIGLQVPPKFVQIEITDEDDPSVIETSYCKNWDKFIDYEFIGHDYVIDGHRLRVFIRPELVSVSGSNSLTLSMVESYLLNWNTTIYSTSQNEVIFDAIVYNTICSNGFWNKDVSLIIFTENNYNESTGIHEIEADYSGSEFASLPKNIIENIISFHGGIVIKHPTNKVTFQINRNSVFDVFKQDVKEKVDGIFDLRCFKIPSTYIQMALDNNGTLSITKSQLAAYIHYLLDD